MFVFAGITSPVGDLKAHLCRLCPERFGTHWDLKSHLEAKHPGRFNLTCDVCGKGYISLSALTMHKQKHSGTVLL